MNHIYYNLKEYNRDIYASIYLRCLEQINIIFNSIPNKKIYGPPSEFSYFKKIIDYISDIINIFESNKLNINKYINDIINSKSNCKIIAIFENIITNNYDSLDHDTFLKQICHLYDILEYIFMICNFFQFQEPYVSTSINKNFIKDKFITLYNSKITFSIQNRCVSNLQYLKFVLNKGYNISKYWSIKGKKWLKTYPKNHPFFWKKSGNIWYVKKFDQYFNIDNISNHPVDNISYYEAEAFCNYKNVILPTLDHMKIIISNENYSKFNIGYVWEWTSSIDNNSICIGGSSYNKLIIKNINDTKIINKSAQHYFTGFRTILS